MKKKIKNVTIEEMLIICKEKLYDCESCPFYLFCLPISNGVSFKSKLENEIEVNNKKIKEDLIKEIEEITHTKLVVIDDGFNSCYSISYHFVRGDNLIFSIEKWTRKEYCMSGGSFMLKANLLRLLLELIELLNNELQRN